jgi:hypothetical protein
LCRFNSSPWDLTDENAISANWLWSNLLGGVKVQVLESEIEMAGDLIQSEQSGEPDEGDPWGAAAIVCPACGGSDSRYFLDRRVSFLTWLVLGFPVFPAISKRICGGRGRKWIPGAA